jgi:hypothetical protein
VQYFSASSHSLPFSFSFVSPIFEENLPASCGQSLLALPRCLNQLLVQPKSTVSRGQRTPERCTNRGSSGILSESRSKSNLSHALLVSSNRLLLTTWWYGNDNAYLLKLFPATVFHHLASPFLSFEPSSAFYVSFSPSSSFFKMSVRHRIEDIKKLFDAERKV